MIVRQSDGSRSAMFSYDKHTIIKGKPKLNGLPAAYTQTKDEAQTLVIELVDKVSQLKLALIYTIYRNRPVVTRSVQVINGGTETVHLEKIASMAIDLPAGDKQVISLPGAHVNERHVDRQDISFGTKVFQSRRGTTSHQMNTLIDKLLTHELKDDYQAFKTTAQKMDAIMTATHGQQHQGQAKRSETQDQRLRKELANGIYRQFNEQFKPGSHENDDKFHKQANGNFEKAKQKQQPAEKPQLKQHKAAPLGKLNKIAKRMTKQSRQEMQQVERMLQETMAEQSQDVSDESLTRHL